VGATPLDVQAWEYLRDLGSKVMVVATKVDRIARGRRGAMEKGVGEVLELDGTVPLIPVSAHSGEGMKELWSAIAHHLESSAE
jgi:GTP-binding protein